MQNCPNPKCGSQMPDAYKRCIYCAAKMPKNEKNIVKKERAKVTVAQMGLALCAVAMVAFIIVNVLSWME